MKIALYTPAGIIANETYHVASLLDKVDYLFLRKPGIHDSYWEDYVEEIPIVHAHKVMTSYYRVLHDAGLGGFHFRSSMIDQLSKPELLENITLLRNHEKKSSVTAHNMEQLKTYDGMFDIIMVAPLFESISKPGHQHHWDFEELKSFLQQKSHKSEVFALGGIDETKVDMIHLLGFDGLAVLGTIWNQDPYQAPAQLQKILDKC
jgi:thiamine-phosphate pyrophosphorylase